MPRPGISFIEFYIRLTPFRETLLGLKQGNLNSLHGYTFRLNPSVTVKILTLCENLQLGMKFVDIILLNCPNMRHSSQSLSVIFHVLLHGRRLSEAQALILRMVRRSGVSRFKVVESLVSTYHSGCGSNPLVFDLLVRTCVQAKKLKEGSNVFQMLRSKGSSVSINACNNLLGGLVKVGWVDLAWEVYWEVVRSGIGLNVYRLNVMANALCKHGKVDHIKLFLSDMEEKGIFPDKVTYNVLINAYCCQGLLEEAFRVVNFLSSNGLRRGLLTYNTIINELCQVGNFTGAK